MYFTSNILTTVDPKRAIAMLSIALVFFGADGWSQRDDVNEIYWAYDINEIYWAYDINEIYWA